MNRTAKPRTAGKAGSRRAERPLAMILWYDFLRVVLRLVATVVFRIRCHGRDYVPQTGGALILPNHQSYLDPVLIGIGCNRRMNYLARVGLFHFAPLRWLIRSLDAIPIDRTGANLMGLKEMLRRLKQGEMVLIFPEGNRTWDGEIGPLQPGFCALASRAKVPIVPAAMEGAFQAWPRWRLLPRPGTIHVSFGPPIPPEQIARLDDEALMAEVDRRMRQCFAETRARRARSRQSTPRQAARG
jgi:1-acyl-sn-glycerol-3-phosphate acyltransferase